MTHQTGDLPAQLHLLTGGVPGMDILAVRVIHLTGLARLIKPCATMCFQAVRPCSVYDPNGDCIMLLHRVVAALLVLLGVAWLVLGHKSATHTDWDAPTLRDAARTLSGSVLRAETLGVDGNADTAIDLHHARRHARTGSSGAQGHPERWH